MRLRSLPLTVLCVLTFTGCGAADSIKTTQAMACPADEPQVRVKDILPVPPPGTELVSADPQGAKPIKDELRSELGDTLRSVSSRVVAKRGRAMGAGVFVVNIDERMEPSEVIRGAEASADELGIDPQPITMAGEEGVLAIGPEGAVATGAVGECSAATIIAADEAEVRAVAESLRRAE